MPLSPITPRRMGGSHVDVSKCFGLKVSPAPVPTALGESRAASYKRISDIGGDLSQLQGKSVSHSLSREDDGLCQQKMAGDVSCVPGRQQRTRVMIRSHQLLPPTPYFRFLRTPRSVQFENGNRLFYLKRVPGPSPPERRQSLQTAVGAKFDYSAARTKAWVSAEDPLCMPDQRPAAL